MSRRCRHRRDTSGCRGAGNRSARRVLALGIAHHQHRVFAHVSGEEVARPRDLALVAQKQPTAGEYPLQLLVVDLRLYKDPAPDESAFGIDQTGDIDLHKTLREVPMPGKWTTRATT